MKRFLLTAALITLAAGAACANVIQGTITYKDLDINSSGVGVPQFIPARYVFVQFVRQSNPSAILGQRRTDDSGVFAATEVGTPDDLLIIVQANALRLGQEIVVRDREFNTGAIQTYAEGPFDLSGGNLVDQGIEISTSGASFNIAGAFNILDTLTVTWEHVCNDLFAAPPVDSFTITCWWNDGDDPVDGTTFFMMDAGEPTLHILGDEAADSDAFDDDVLQHEYGHFLHERFSLDNSSGGMHTLGDDIDIRLAFSEGWGNSFSCIISDLKGDDDPAVYVDTNAGANFIFDFDNVDTTTYNGSDDEVACTATIWELYSNDAANPGAPYDQTDWPAGVDTAAKAIWKIFNEYLPLTESVSMEDLWDGWFVLDFGGNATNAGIARNIVQNFGIDYYVVNEPNNTRAEAAELTPDTPVVATYYREDATAEVITDDEDWFKFTNDTVGLTYQIKTQNLANACDTSLTLQKADGSTVTSDDDGGAGLASRIVFTTDEVTTYYVRSARPAKPLPFTAPATTGATANYGSYEIVLSLSLPNTDPPDVANIEPVDGSTDVSILADITVQFTKEIDPSTVTSTSFYITEENAPTTPVPAVITVDATNKNATLNPDAGLLGNATYTVALLTTITDADGRPLAGAFSSQFTTGTGTPVVGDGSRPDEVPFARAASGDSFIDVEWWHPTTDFASIIVAAGTDRFPTIEVTTDADGNANFSIDHGQEVYRGVDELTTQIPVGNGSSRFVNIWAVNGTEISDPVAVSSTASRGGRGLASRTLQPETIPEIDPTIPRVTRFRAAAGSGFIDIEWDVPDGAEGVIVAAGSKRHPQLQLVTGADDEQILEVVDGSELFRGTDRLSGRLQVGNGSGRFFNIWTFEGTKISRPLAAASRAAPGGVGITEDSSIHGAEPEPFQESTTTQTDDMTQEEWQQYLDQLQQQLEQQLR